MPTIRPYDPADKPALLALFDENTPPYFALHERDVFSGFLDEPQGEYLVVLRDQTIVACGGYWIVPGAPFAALSWLIVARQSQRQGYGRLLVETCLRDLRALERVEQVILETSQYSTSFFEKFGFSISGIQEDGFGQGLDIYSMVLDLTPAASA